jgi:LmbE family N-acetylglucosaminyl deacetylase
MYKAATSLGLAHCNVHHLNQRDTQAPRSGPEFEAAIRFVSELVKNRGAESLFCTWRHDPHCDHQAASDLANRAAAISPGIKQWAYPIWGWHLPPEDDLPGSPSGVRINIAAHIKKKRAAISAHRSQVTHLIEDDPTGFYFTKERLSPFIGKYEYFLEVVS